MISFKQNNEITYDDKDLVDENSFIGAEIEKTPIPIFSEIKDKDILQLILDLLEKVEEHFSLSLLTLFHFLQILHQFNLM